MRVLVAVLCLAVGACKRQEAAGPEAGSPPPAVPSPVASGVVVRERNIRAPVTITVAAPESVELNLAFEAAFAEVERMDEVLSDWRDTSELGRLNKQAGVAPMKVSPELFELLSTALKLSDASSGGFDVTFASLWGLWSFKQDAPRMPTKEELAARLPLVGYQALKLDAKEQTAFIERTGTRVGLGALGDGYSAQRASGVLIAKGFPNHLVLIGGDGTARGKRADRAWRVGIRDPQTGGIWGTVELHDEGVSTSGNYQKYFMKDGVRYHHIIDPKTGYPARGTAAVTVLASDARLADGWGTALFVLGPQKGLEVAKKENLEALWFDEEFNVSGTEGMMKRVERVAQQP